MTSQVLLDTRAQRRAAVIRGAANLLGSSNVRAFCLPSFNEGLVMPDAFVAGQSWTYSAAVASRLRTAGQGFGVAFDGTSQNVTTADRAGLSFGNGAADTPFTIAMMVRVDDTAALRRLCIKGTEYALDVSAADKLSTLLVDTGGVAVPSRLQDVALTTQGVPAFYSTTYSAATGGAGAANDITQYVNGNLVASTATNAAYTAMGDKATALGFMAQHDNSSGWAPGVLYAGIIAAGNVSAATHRALAGLFARYFAVNI